MTRRATVRQIDIKRAVEAMRSAGVPSVAVEIDPSGKVTVREASKPADRQPVAVAREIVL